ncbi:MAG: hypothetical protein EB020_13530 [Proteobacteria bacterium]|nr:hypothetical protein [Pseudomonadota bacterium]
MPVFSETLASKTTGAPGTYALSDISDDVLTLSLARGTTDAGNAISSQDALAALKIAVGRNPNTDPDGAGPLQPNLVSPYQFIAADVTGDGRVTSQDALAILKMAVRRVDAPSREQLVAELPFARVITFVDEGTSVGAYKDSPCHPYRPRSRFSSLFRTVRTREWIGGGIRAYFERTASIRARTPGQPRPMPS